MVSTLIDIEPLVLGKVPLVSEVPFPCEERPVASPLQSLGDRRLLQAQVVGIPRPKQLAVPGVRSRNPVRDVHTYGVAPCHDTRACRAADGT